MLNTEKVVQHPLDIVERNPTEINSLHEESHTEKILKHSVVVAAWRLFG